MLFNKRSTAVLLVSVLTLMSLISCATSTSSASKSENPYMPVDGKAVVFFARPSGMAVATINIDDKPVGTMKGGENIKLTLNAGEYTISHIGAAGSGPSVLKLSAKANEVYFIEIDFGGMGGAKSALLDKEAGEKLVNKSSKPGVVF